LDLTIGFALFFLVGTAVAGRVGALTPDGFHVTGVPALLVIGSVSGAVFLYFWLWEWLGGRTFGKMVFQLRVVSQNGGRCGLAASLIRNLIRPVDAFPFYLFGLIAVLMTEQQQRLGDLAAKTRVVVSGSKMGRIVGIVGLVLILIGSGIGVYYLRKAGSGSGRLEIQELQFTEGEDGAAVQRAYKPGEELFFKFRLAGVTTDSNGLPHVSIVFEPKDSQGRPLLEPIPLQVKEPLPPGVRESGGVPIYFHLSLPSYAEGGNYLIPVSVRDELASKETAATVPFAVEGPRMAADPTLGMQDYQFRDGAGNPKAEPTYGPGETVHSFFLARGFRMDGNKALRLNLAMTVRDAAGQVLLEQPGLLKVEEKFFYPPSYLPLTTTVNTPASLAPGVYTIHYTLTDQVAGAQADFEASFRVP
jgi:uncharacterized RDD family membrane protein YckC